MDGQDKSKELLAVIDGCDIYGAAGKENKNRLAKYGCSLTGKAPVFTGDVDSNSTIYILFKLFNLFYIVSIFVFLSVFYLIFMCLTGIFFYFLSLRIPANFKLFVYV